MLCDLVLPWSQLLVLLRLYCLCHPSLRINSLLWLLISLIPRLGLLHAHAGSGLLGLLPWLALRGSLPLPGSLALALALLVHRQQRRCTTASSA